jgi:glycosyltransferase involved in cell wall biosynthesis
MGSLVQARRIYNAIDLSRFSPVGPVLDLDALAGLPPANPETIKVGLVGTLARWKGHSVFLRAVSLISGGIPVRAYVVGDAIYETKGSQYTIDELRAMTRELGIEHKVGFTGYVEEPASAMRALDILVHASTRPEPFGLVIAEGMACGRAVITTGTGGAAEIVSPPSDALTHIPGDAGMLARRIEQLAVDPQLRADLGMVARANVARRFDRTRLAHEFAAVYCEVTQRARVGSRNR